MTSEKFCPLIHGATEAYRDDESHQWVHTVILQTMQRCNTRQRCKQFSGSTSYSLKVVCKTKDPVKINSQGITYLGGWAGTKKFRNRLSPVCWRRYPLARSNTLNLALQSPTCYSRGRERENVLHFSVIKIITIELTSCLRPAKYVDGIL